MIIHPHGTAVFCDDIRMERSGKLIFVGVYRDAILFGGPPPWGLANGLNCHIIYREVRGETPPDLRFEFRMQSKTKNETVLTIQQDTKEILDDVNVKPFQFEKDSIKMLQYIFAANLRPFQIEEETKISIIAVRNDEEIFIDRIRVSGVPENFNPNQ